MSLTNLDRFTVMNAEVGKKYALFNPATGLFEVVRCEGNHTNSPPASRDMIYFTRDTCPDRLHDDEIDGDYSQVFQHVRAGTSGVGYCIHTREQFATMFASKNYCIA